MVKNVCVVTSRDSNDGDHMWLSWVPCHMHSVHDTILLARRQGSPLHIRYDLTRPQRVGRCTHSTHSRSLKSIEPRIPQYRGGARRVFTHHRQASRAPGANAVRDHRGGWEFCQFCRAWLNGPMNLAFWCPEFLHGGVFRPVVTTFIAGILLQAFFCLMHGLVFVGNVLSP